MAVNWQALLNIGLQAASLVPGVGTYINLALPIVGTIEELFGPGKGAAKKEAATAMIADAINLYNKAAGKNFNNSEIMAGISEIIDGAVKIANAVGAFQKAPAS